MARRDFEPQIIHTAKYGDMKVKMWGHEGPKPIAWLENDSFANDGGHAITDKKELRQAFPAVLLADVLLAFESHQNFQQTAGRKIEVTRDNRVIFADTGEAVAELQDIVDYFEPGPFREAAMVAFAEKLRADKEAQMFGKKPKTKLPAKPKGRAARPAPARGAAAEAPGQVTV